MSRMIIRLAPLAAALFLGACANDSMPNLFQTASTTPVDEAAAAPAPRAPRVDTACAALSGQIEALRKDGTIERLEKVASGKGDNVQVKRTAIAKQAELNKANAEFQTRCGPRMPAHAAVAPGAASGVTAVPSATTPAPAVAKAP